MKIEFRNIILSLLALFTGILSLSGQNISTGLEPGKILMGEPVELSFTIEFHDSLRMEMPVFNEQITDKAEILHYGTTDKLPSTEPNHLKVLRTLRITSWEEGFHPIKPFVFRFISATDTLEVESEPVLLEVEPFILDEHADIKDIKSIISAPVTLGEILPWLLALWLLAAIITGIVLYLKKRKPRAQPQTIWQKPDIPAHIAAISSLEKLKAQKLWQQGKVKQYHSELTDILRHYIEKRYGIHAMEMTSSEIMEAINGKPDKKEAEEILGQCMQLADLVKFAKYSPEAQDNEKSMEAAFEFVNLTRLREQENKKESVHKVEND